MLQVIAVDKSAKGNNKAADAGHLGGFKHTQNQISIVSPQVFQKEPGGAVQHDIQCKGLPLGMRKSTEQKQQGKNNKVQLAFPDFCRPQRLRTIGMVG